MNEKLVQGGKRALSALERIRLALEPVSRLFLGKTVLDTPPSGHLTSFETQAEELMSLQKTARAQRIIRTGVAAAVLLLVWSSFAEIDEVTRGDGKVIPSRQLQVVQSLDGGVVSEILVKEGQVVEPNQVLLKIDETRATSGVLESEAQSFSLRVKQARLKALAEGIPFTPPSPGTPAESHIVEEERNLYLSRTSELSAMMSINRQQVSQRQQELNEAEAKRSAAGRALALAQEELRKTRPLLSSGAISEVDVLRLERDVSRNRGDAEQASAQISRARAAIGEAERKIQETSLAFRNEARRELSEVLGKINTLNQGSAALTDRVDKAQVRSPVRGRVQRLMANTVGGVVQPGKDLVEIVPLDDTLVLEAKVQPRDIAFIHPKQKATVKFTAYDFSIYGGLDAVVENISPDTQVDEKGNAFYVVRVKTEHAQFGEDKPIIPGMTAEVDILTGKKTVLSYLLKPVLKAKTYALSER